jgi:phytoene dehydrogenase-like protein
MRPLDAPGTAAFGLLMAMLGHAVGWPVVEGGSGRLVDVLVDVLTELGGEWWWTTRALPRRRCRRAAPRCCDVTPRQLLSLAGDRLPPRARRRLRGSATGQGSSS